MPKTKNKSKEKKAQKKKPIKKVKKEAKRTKTKVPGYFRAIGRRKTATARVRLFNQDNQGILINDKPLEVYFANVFLQEIVKSPLEVTKCLDKFKVTVVVKGGGITSQAEAIRHGISRALVSFNPDFKKELKGAGFLKRDPRMRERKKFGLKRARRAPQWSKR